jgi:DNA-binding NtrC family response regulator
MQEIFTIVIADRNPHVRGFLQREMGREGYRIRLAENAQDLLKWVFNHESIDLIILDPDLPDAVDSHLLSTLQNRIPPVPVIIHTHYSQTLPQPEAGTGFIIVEKGGSSVERLKEVADDILRHPRSSPCQSLETAPSSS